MLEKVHGILESFQKISDLWDELTSAEQEYLSQMHTEAYTLGYCIRLCAQAAEECFVGIAEAMEFEGKTFKVGKNQIYLDKIANQYVVEKFEYNDEYKGTGEPMYSVVDGFDDLESAVQCATKT